MEALLEARRRPIPISTKVLVAVQPNAGNGWSALPGTKVELQQIHEIVPSETLLAPSSPSDLKGEQEGLHTTLRAITTCLPNASVFHLACHGDQCPSISLQSGFIVRDGVTVNG